MSNIFLRHIYVMYSIWFAAGVMLLVYIGYRRKRISAPPPDVPDTQPTTGASH